MADIEPELSRGLLAAGVLVAALGQLGLGLSEPQGPSKLAVFALGCLGPVPESRNSRWWSRVSSPRATLKRATVAAAVAFGLAMALLLLYRLVGGSTAGLDLLPWIATMVAFAIPLAAGNHVTRIALTRVIGVDAMVVVALIGVFLALNVRDLEHWYYSAIGDEYAFYLGARGILEDGITRLFSQAGVYGEQPVLNSAYQALVMAVAGKDNFGWRFASLLSIAVTIPGVYLLGRTLGDRKVAVVAATLFALSHYLFAYAHTGYNNIHALAPTVWALALFVMGIRRRNSLLLYAAGLVAGLGFYTHFAARGTIPIMVLFILTESELRHDLRRMWPIGLGFIVAAWPIFAVSGAEVLSRMFGQVPGGYSSEVSGPAAERIQENLSNNLLAFNYNPDLFHYVSGPLLDPITAVAAVLGIGLALGRWREGRYRFLLVWALVAVTATGIMSPYPQVAISRLNFVVPPLALLAGFAAAHLWETMIATGSSSMTRWVEAGLAVALVLIVLGWNVRQFWWKTPEVFHLTQEAVAIGAIRSEECGGRPEKVVIVARQTEPLLEPALASYFPDGDGPRLLDHRELTPGQPPAIASVRCVIFANPEDSEARLALEALRRRHASGLVTQFQSRAGNTSVKIFALEPD